MICFSCSVFRVPTQFQCKWSMQILNRSKMIKKKKIMNNTLVRLHHCIFCMQLRSDTTKPEPKVKIQRTNFFDLYHVRFFLSLCVSILRRILLPLFISFTMLLRFFVLLCWHIEKEFAILAVQRILGIFSFIFRHHWLFRVFFFHSYDFFDLIFSC